MDACGSACNTAIATVTVPNDSVSHVCCRCSPHAHSHTHELHISRAVHTRAGGQPKAGGRRNQLSSACLSLCCCTSYRHGGRHLPLLCTRAASWQLPAPGNNATASNRPVVAVMLRQALCNAVGSRQKCCQERPGAAAVCCCCLSSVPCFKLLCLLVSVGIPEHSTAIHGQ